MYLVLLVSRGVGTDAAVQSCRGRSAVTLADPILTPGGCRWAQMEQKEGGTSDEEVQREQQRVVEIIAAMSRDELSPTPSPDVEEAEDSDVSHNTSSEDSDAPLPIITLETDKFI
ncbi:hypothetical protein NDU88_005088 [Pleurodeles waltl]|uniref:Uncharacterized protein n=1 Tax=Pleurodeles waltl TaxID=8319 RepID=A0AAV7MX10_PLEWA|nr:hypothetical protein NDU88_005088 [Pleurodeles waltl]